MFLSFEEMRGVCCWPNWNGEEELALTKDQIYYAEEMWNEFPRAEVDVTPTGLIILEIPISNKQVILIIFGPKFHQFALFIDDVMNLEVDQVENHKSDKTSTALHNISEFYKWYSQAR